MAKLAVVADEETVSYFKMIGVKRSFAVHSAEDAAKRIGELSSDQDIAVIITTEKIAEALHALIQQISMAKLYPLIVAIPDKKGPIPRKVDPIADLLKRTVGVEIKVQ